jgi:ABC-type antimicrobial peptide transport system permease subunit
MKRIILGFLLIISVTAFAQSKGPFDSFLKNIFENSKNEVIFIAKQSNVNIIDYFVLGTKDMSGVVIERKGDTIINIFGFRWDPQKREYILEDVEGGEQSIARAREIIKRIFSVEFRVIRGATLETEVYK